MFSFTKTQVKIQENLILLTEGSKIHCYNQVFLIEKFSRLCRAHIPTFMSVLVVSL